MQNIDTVDIPPRTFWKENQYKYPAFASAARDVLSIPATGAGVERLFNSARDICHYRWGSLNATTIQDLMMYICASRFNLEEQQLELLDDFLSEEEKQEATEEKSAELLDDLDLISDDEDNAVLVYEQSAMQQLSEQATGKKRRNMASEAEAEGQEGAQSDVEADIPLPEIASTQQRMSRSWKRSRCWDDDFVHY